MTSCCDEKHFVGKEEIFAVEVRDRITGSLVDPTALTLKIRYLLADNTYTDVLSFTLAASQVVRDSLGKFHYNYTPDTVGELFWKWYATGAAVGSVPGSITIEADAFDT